RRARDDATERNSARTERTRFHAGAERSNSSGVKVESGATAVGNDAWSGLKAACQPGAACQSGAAEGASATTVQPGIERSGSKTTGGETHDTAGVEEKI